MVAGSAALEARSVLKTYGDVVALNAVSLRVAAGECVALVGESGSGKTTLLRLFNRMIDPDRGEILANGQDVAPLDPVRLRRRMGYVPQTGGLLPHWSVLRNVALVPWLDERADADRAAQDALELVGLAPATFAARRPSELS